jgi:hypothetical protein
MPLPIRLPAILARPDQTARRVAVHRAATAQAAREQVQELRAPHSAAGQHLEAPRTLRRERLLVVLTVVQAARLLRPQATKLRVAAPEIRGAQGQPEVAERSVAQAARVLAAR